MENQIYKAGLRLSAAMCLGVSQFGWAVEQMSDDQLQSTALPVVLVMQVNSAAPANCSALAPSGLISQSLSQAQTLGRLACQQSEENPNDVPLNTVNADQYVDAEDSLISAQAELGEKLDLSVLAEKTGSGSDTPLANDFLNSIGFNITQNDQFAFNANLVRGSLGSASNLDDALIDYQVLSFINDQYGLGNGTVSLLGDILLSDLDSFDFTPAVNQDFGVLSFRSDLYIDYSYSEVDFDLALETVNVRAGDVTAVVTVIKN